MKLVVVQEDVSEQVLNSLSRADILRSRSQISLLFAKGKTFLHYPLKATVLVERVADSTPRGEVTLLGMFMVAKRNHRRAVVRNLLRRRMKEAYRLSAQELRRAVEGGVVGSGEGVGLRISISWAYVSREKLDYNTISDAVTHINQKIVDRAIHFVD